MDLLKSLMKAAFPSERFPYLAQRDEQQPPPSSGESGAEPAAATGTHSLLALALAAPFQLRLICWSPSISSAYCELLLLVLAQ